jgi:hypothetical protein
MILSIRHAHLISSIGSGGSGPDIAKKTTDARVGFRSVRMVI